MYHKCFACAATLQRLPGCAAASHYSHFTHARPAQQPLGASKLLACSVSRQDHVNPSQISCHTLLQVMWSIGCTALLISSLVMTAMIAYMDHFDMASPDLPDDDDLEAGQSLTAAHAAAARTASAAASRAAAGSPDVLELAATAGSHSLGPAISAALAAEQLDGSVRSTARQGSVQLQGGVADRAACPAESSVQRQQQQHQQ
jgi:hypothetical protein